jgi:hypothetical protein
MLGSMYLHHAESINIGPCDRNNSNAITIKIEGLDSSRFELTIFHLSDAVIEKLMQAKAILEAKE